jgi:uncharacterized protein with ATP-grasp and redox domains
LSDYEIPSLQIDSTALPPPLLTSEPGSFARHTFMVRIPHIVDETLGHNQFSPDIRENLLDLRAEILDGRIRQLREVAPDGDLWGAVSAPFVGRTWFEVPWYWAEAYFYRRLLEATRYFQPGTGKGFDPFSAMKSDEWQPTRAPHAVEELMSALPAEGYARFVAFVRASLWGNRIDLSYRAVVGLGIAHGASTNLLVDDTERAWRLLRRRPADTVIVVNDNAGTELAMDLALADFLLGSGLAGQVVLHLKQQPFFVSDALPGDVREGLDALAAGPRHGAELAARLMVHLDAGRLQLRTHWFYTTSLFYFQSPADLQAELATAGLVVVKGDANYRRLFGDAHWPTTTPFAAASAYFPAPLLALRTLKSEIILGLQAGEAERLNAQDPDWLVNGQRGVIQANLPS